ncbi:MAG: carbonic anhydrase [Candidatus Thermofonsia Clade 1 bacterium]|uniref:Carbonic anhydrase n=1 Tax=Candidatus Thermofonsia Clade 1 bacterium TaxID=2364210 RepID=A0A2M8NYX7_9CHLR|nr:MAG: carbonic anhydrase [Candidatus Thermofonsia Clade 1 bacterium]
MSCRLYRFHALIIAESQLLCRGDAALPIVNIQESLPMTTPAAQALERLLAGNRRYVAMRQVHPRQTELHRQTLVEGQHPFAAILSCSDSRVPAEIIFDQGLGDLFIVRTAGHAVDALVLASLEYAVLALGVPLIMVLGHGQCGAVKAVLSDQAQAGHLPYLAARLRPALADLPPDALDQAIRQSAHATASSLAAESDILATACAEGRLTIAPAYYDLPTGAVSLL